MAYSTCSSCDQTFSGLSNFDQHQEWGGGSNPIHCIAPDEIGLTRKDGVWGNWDTDLNIGSTYTRKTDPKELTCRDCGRKWSVPRSRGRYPTRCANCS